MIPFPTGVRVWLAAGATDMRRGMNGLSLQVQQALERDPHGGDLYVFWGRRGDLVKCLWHDDTGMSLYVKRLERGRFVWPQAREGVVSLTPATFSMLLEGIDWRNPQRTWRPEMAAGDGGLTNCPRKGGYTAGAECACLCLVTPAPEPVPDDIEALRAALAAERLARREAEARASGAEAMVAHLKLLIAQLKHDRFGASSERGRKLLDQLELQLEELEAASAEAALGPDQEGLPSRPRAIRRKPVRGPLPAHLPRQRVVIPRKRFAFRRARPPARAARANWPSSARTSPKRWRWCRGNGRWCRPCASGSPAGCARASRSRRRRSTPLRAAGPELLAMILEAKFGQHLPLNRQSDTYAREGIEIDVSTMADWVGGTATLAPLTALIEAHVMAAARIHGDDTTVPVLAKGKTATGRLWAYVRDDQPFGGPAPPAAVFFYSPDRQGEQTARASTRASTWPATPASCRPTRMPEKRDAFAPGSTTSTIQGASPPKRAAFAAGPVTEAGCWAHGRRKLFDLAQVARAPLAAEAVRRTDVIFDVERSINGLPAGQRLAIRQKHVAPLVADLETWMRAARGKMSRHAEVAKAMDYMLKRWDTFSRFLGDGRICLSNNAAERALRGVALGRKSWLFAGSDRGGDRAAAMYSLIITAKLSDVDPRAWLADVLRRIAGHPASRLHELLPWNWRKTPQDIAAAA